MNKIDKWCAEHCGVELLHDGVTADTDTNRTLFDGYINQKWTIQNPLCREIVRERFGINTSYEGKWMASRHMGNGKLLVRSGETIAEAEIACITAIYEARDE